MISEDDLSKLRERKNSNDIRLEGTALRETHVECHPRTLILNNEPQLSAKVTCILTNRIVECATHVRHATATATAAAATATASATVTAVAADVVAVVFAIVVTSPSRSKMHVAKCREWK
ncbi:hypothetical protein V1478_005882 [Vespula squamosa]|uniref:Uncharacterized protein n=1 Tax=Vespula squamosa TaxID=30214 RepID=A0ABD2BA57_VESSQ